MWKWNWVWYKKYRTNSLFLRSFLSFLCFSLAFADPLDRFLGERHSERIKQYAKDSYTFVVAGGDPSLKSNECRKVVVTVKKGKLPVAGKKVAVSFSRVAKVQQSAQGDFVFTQHFEKSTDYLGQINFCFVAEKVGSLEVLFFFLHSVHGHNQHLERLFYDVYDESKAYGAFFLPFWLLIVFFLFIVGQWLFVSFFPHAKDFFATEPPQKYWSKEFLLNHLFLFLLGKKRLLRFIFPVLWCHSHPSLVANGDEHLAPALKKNDALEQMVFAFVAMIWVCLYGYFPSLGILSLLILLILVQQRWFLCFYVFALMQILFFVGLPNAGVSILHVQSLASRDFLYGMVILAFFFPTPLIWGGFLLLLLQKSGVSWWSKMLELDFSFLREEDNPVLFVLAKPLFLLFCVSSVSAVNVYCYGQKKKKKKDCV